MFLVSITSIFAGEGYYKCKAENSIHLAECCKEKQASCCPKISKSTSVTEYKKVCCTFEKLSDVEDSLLTTQKSQQDSIVNNLLFFHNFFSGIIPFLSIRKQQRYFSSVNILYPHSKKDLYKSLCLYLC